MFKIKNIKIEILIEISIKTQEIMLKSTNKDIEIQEKACISLRVFFHLPSGEYQLLTIVKNFKTRNNNIKDDAIIR